MPGGRRAGAIALPHRVFNDARELEIRNFKPRSFWRVTARFDVTKGSYECVYQRPNFKRVENDEHDRIDRIWEKALADAVVAACAPPLSASTY